MEESSDNNHTKHLTDGPLWKGVFALAGPMFFSSILQNIQSLIDLFWVGNLGSSSVAALALSGTILMILFPVIMGMSAGTIALISRRVGEGLHDEASEAAGQSLVMSLGLGVAAGAVGWFFSRRMCVLLVSDAEVIELASSYLSVSFLGSFTIFVLFMSNSILQGAGNTIVPMLAMALANILNLILDPIFIFGLWGFPAMGVSGAALATVISQAIAAVTALLILSGGVARIRLQLNSSLVRLNHAWIIIKVGFPSSAQMLSRSLMALVLMSIVAKSGTSAVAAYGIALRFQMIILMPAFALGAAAATMVGQNLGAGKPARAHTAAWVAAGTDMGIMLIAAAILIAFAPFFMGFFDTNPDVIAIGVSHIRTVSPFYIFVAMAIIFGRALQGAGCTMATMVSTIICLWGLQVPLALAFSKTWHPPTQGVWWAVAIAISAHGIINALLFQHGGWKKKKL